MKLYLVRHATTKVNIDSKVHQPPDEPLSSSGKKQALAVGERLGNVKVDHFFSSAYPRAKQTAAIVSPFIGEVPIIFDILTEKKNPSELYGLPYDHPKAIKIKKIIKRNYHIPLFRYSDEETYFEFRGRVNTFLNSLKKFNDNTVVAVTHGHFITLLVGIITFGEEFGPREYLEFDKLIDIKNTSVTSIEISGGDYHVDEFNDITHLKPQTSIPHIRLQSLQEVKS